MNLPNLAGSIDPAVTIGPATRTVSTIPPPFEEDKENSYGV